jgi:sensor histidine kinase YesM
MTDGSRIHNVLYLSFLKKALRQHVTNSIDISPLDEEGQLVSTPKKIIDVRERRLRIRVI